MARRSSKSTVFTVPAFATTIAGRPFNSARAASSWATSTASRFPASTGTWRSRLRPMPRTESALVTLEWGLPESTSTGPSAAAPSCDTSTPRRSPSHSRATASPTVLDTVAPVTKAPECASPSPNSSRSQSTVSRSRAAAQDPAAPDTFWS